MNCPHQDKLIPRCDITTHPQRPNVEYCRVCGEWRHLDSVGDERPRLLSFLVAFVILAFVLAGILSTEEQSRQQPNPAPAPWGQQPSHDTQIGSA